MTDCQEKAEPTRRARAALYVDGFNMYHALAELGEAHLKWLNLAALGKLIIPKETEDLVRVVFCTAFYPGDPQKKWRHQMYLNALAAVGAEKAEGHYITIPMECRNCTGGWDAPTEKEGDINVAIHVINDAWRGVYDHAYLLSADSDQAATFRLFREQFPNLRITTVAPPRRNFSTEVLKYATGRIALNKDHIARCLFPPVVIAQNGKHGRRPREYDPPPGWVPPA